MPLLYACSSNPGKLREFTAQLPVNGAFTIQTLPGMSEITAPPEDAPTYQENAALKALYYSQFTGEMVLADDTGLEVSALGGAPGIYSARFAGPQASGSENNALLLEKLRNVTDRRARFVTSIALARQGHLLYTATGSAEGEILPAPRGSLGFGYDVLFHFPPLGKTFAELDDTEKFAVSARGDAFRLILAWLAAEP
jgi:XTP/dITP diphosphohydrolase